MKITNPAMLKKMERVLEAAGGIHTLDDIGEALQKGTMFSHVVGETWILTEIIEYPRKKVANITYVIGNLSDALTAEAVVEEWANNAGVDFITATGRSGWWGFRSPGWRMMGTLYSKELDNGRRRRSTSNDAPSNGS